MSARPSWFLFLSTPVLFLVLLLNDEGWRCLAQKRVFHFNPFCDKFNLINQDVATQVFFTLLLGVPKVRYIYFMKSHHCFLNFGCQRKLYALS